MTLMNRKTANNFFLEIYIKELVYVKGYVINKTWKTMREE